MQEASTARKLEYQEFSNEAKKIKKLKYHLCFFKDLEKSDDPKLEALMMKFSGKINQYAIDLGTKYKGLNKFKELDSTQLYHVIINSNLGSEYENFDLKGEDSIRLFLINLLPEVNEKRKELGLAEINLSELGISPEDLTDLDLADEKIKKLF